MNTLFNYTVLDIETTGFDFRKNEIIEIGAIKFKEGNQVGKFSEFIKPKEQVPLFIKQLTNITDAQLASGIDLKSALTSLRKFVENDIIICHNTGFDIGFLNEKYSSLGMSSISNRIFDTLEISRIYLPFLLNHKLGTVAEYFEIDVENAHRAIFDAEVTGLIFSGLLNFIDEHIEPKLNYEISKTALLADLDTDLSYFLEKITDYQQKYALLSKKKKSPISFNNKCYVSHEMNNYKDHSIDEIFGEKGLFAGKFENYEIRNGQIEMAKAVMHNFSNDEYLLVEAGTGVGKSLAYLIPAIIHSNKNDAKVIISTNTKNLQEQLFHKDLPTLKECVDIPFKATLLKGRRNYLCEKKWMDSTFEFEKSFTSFDAKIMLYLYVWKEFTQTGDISENSSFNEKIFAGVWRKLSTDGHFCRGRKCQFFSKCYLMNVRKKTENSNLVIINHHLLLADLMSENAVLGEYQNLIIDEAHNLPHLAPGELGLSLGYNDFSNFFSYIFARRKRFQTGIFPSLKGAITKSSFDKIKKEFLLLKIEEIIQIIEDRSLVLKQFFKEIGDVVHDKGSYGKLRLKNLDAHPFISSYLNEIIEFIELLSKSVMTIINEMKGIKSSVFVEYETNLDNVKGVQQKLAEFYDAVQVFYNPDFVDNVFWMESFRTKIENYPNGILNQAPLNINELMNELLYKNVKSVVFTSATIAIRGKFKYFAGRMGLDLLDKDKVQELVVESPFDFDKQALVLVAGFLPQPKDRFFQSQSIELIKEAIEVSKVGTMVLFTSYKDLNMAYDDLNESFYKDKIMLLTQGKGISRSVMLSEFRKNKNAVLFGTNSFWEGIDVPGESLSLLILYKLPFMVPSEPIVEAFIEKLEAEGKNSFLHYMVPNALLKYRQGFGRLIRNKTDRGVVLVFDNRISTKQYGKYFIETVPAKTIITSSPIEIYDYVGRLFKNI